MVPHPLSIVATGPGWLVVDKPIGLSVHNDPGRDLCSGVQALLSWDPSLAHRTGFRPGDGAHAPHRLDRDTSGLVLVCCTAPALQFYGRAFRERQIRKSYLAIVHGRLMAPGGRGTWSFPLARSGGGRATPAGRGKRLASRTAFQVMGHSRHYTLIVCAPLTGRQHQIRRHAKLAGHPVVGDRRYGSPRSLRFLETSESFVRLGLHAHGLELPPPTGDERRRIISSGLPVEFIRLLVADSDITAVAWEGMLKPLADPSAWPPHSA
jgi:23S rRNA-/tRNA-specific pseudouridylate synthase